MQQNGIWKRRRLQTREKLVKLTFAIRYHTHHPASLLVAGPRMRGSHVGPGTFGCGRLGMLFMAFRFLQRKTMGKKKKKHHGNNHNQHHGERGNNPPPRRSDSLSNTRCSGNTRAHPPNSAHCLLDSR